jgi:hypothetical protein
VAELLFWPALLAYGEAAIAYAGDARRPGSMGRLATWGVRIGWLVQTALLVAQAAFRGTRGRDRSTSSSGSSSVRI